MSKIPTKDEGKKPLFCRQIEGGEWVAIGFNIIFCKDCKHRNNPLKCPYYKFDATDDHDFCSRGEKK